MVYHTIEVIELYDMGLRIKELRQKKKLSQAGLASRLDIHKSTVAGYENNTKMPSVDVLIKMAVFFNVSSDYILGLENKKTICVEGLPERKIEFLEALTNEFIADMKQKKS